MSLTEDWKSGKLPRGKKYWCRMVGEEIEICYLWLQTNQFTLLVGYQSRDLPEDDIIEILAPCDYGYISELEKEVQTLANNYNLLKKEQAYNIAHGQALVDEFGDYEALYEELQRLRKVAAKYSRIKVNSNYPDKISRLKSRIKHLLDLQANQDKEVERLRDENKELIGLRKEVAKEEEIIGKLLNEGNVLAVKSRNITKRASTYLRRTWFKNKGRKNTANIHFI